MTTQIFKTALAGMLAGLALFMLPFFLLRVFIFFLIVGAIFRLLGGRRHHRHRHMRYAFAHRYNEMSDEEKHKFNQQYKGNCCYHPFEETTNSSSSNPQ